MTAKRQARRTESDGGALVVELAKLAARVQCGRTSDEVLCIASAGMHRLGVRFAAFQIVGETLVLRCMVHAPPRLTAIEAMIGQRLYGLRAPLAKCEPVLDALRRREILHLDDLDPLGEFFQEATRRDLPPEGAHSTPGSSAGVIAPIFVNEKPWGVLTALSHRFGASNAAAVELFATQVGTALEVAEFIDALEHANQELSTANAELSGIHGELVKRERLASLGELAAVIAHEVRNPLAVIFNSLAALRSTLGPLAQTGDAGALMAIIGEETERINRIVADLLELARPTSLRLEEACLRDLLEDVAASSRAGAGPDGPRVDVVVPEGLPHILMDVRFVRQALLNLVGNAIQAAPVGTAVTLRACIDPREPGKASISVTDRGAGVPAEHRARVFEPFFTTKVSGTGLGLAVVKRIVDAHGGDVRFTTDASGTTFTVSLPDGRSTAT